MCSQIKSVKLPCSNAAATCTTSKLVGPAFRSSPHQEQIANPNQKPKTVNQGHQSTTKLLTIKILKTYHPKLKIIIGYCQFWLENSIHDVELHIHEQYNTSGRRYSVFLLSSSVKYAATGRFCHRKEWLVSNVCLK